MLEQDQNRSGTYSIGQILERCCMFKRSAFLDVGVNVIAIQASICAHRSVWYHQWWISNCEWFTWFSIKVTSIYFTDVSVVFDKWRASVITVFQFAFLILKYKRIWGYQCFCFASVEAMNLNNPTLDPLRHHRRQMNWSVLSSQQKGSKGMRGNKILTNKNSAQLWNH